MANKLDLEASRAKLRRATVHIDALERELERVVNSSKPYTVALGTIDEAAGWVSLDLVARPLVDNEIGVMFGDAVHNLRGALDFIVTACVEHAGAVPKTSHGFPIALSEPEYRKLLRGGRLDGVTEGLPIFEFVQPYNMNVATPRASALWHVQTFSNSDKHRSPAITHYRLGQCNVKFTGADGEYPVEWRAADGGDQVSADPGVRTEVMQLRFDHPFPKGFTLAEAYITLTSVLWVPEFKDERAVGVLFRELGPIRDEVAKIIEVFGKL